MKSVPFRSVLKVPHDIKEGDTLDFEATGKAKITKIKSIEFIDMRTMIVIGLCRNIKE